MNRKLRYREAVLSDLVTFLRTENVYEEFLVQLEKRQSQFYKELSLQEFFDVCLDAGFTPCIIEICFYRTQDPFWLSIQQRWNVLYNLITGNYCWVKVNSINGFFEERNKINIEIPVKLLVKKHSKNQS